ELLGSREIDRRDGDDVDARYSAKGVHVGGAHESRADDGDVDWGHLCSKKEWKRLTCGTPTGGARRRREEQSKARRTEGEQGERNVSGAGPRAQPRALARVLNGLALVPVRSHVAANMPRQDQTWATAWSLEYRLPILISLLLACVVGGLSLAAYRQVRA